MNLKKKASVFSILRAHKTYFLFLSTLGEEKALREVLEESESYEENYTKLADTGFQTVSDDAFIGDQFNSGVVAMDVMAFLAEVNRMGEQIYGPTNKNT